ncbi:Eco57I restriction-modification methylase domain-containing protein [Vibrio vulnificus]|nr:Eco57I restriction-modification methylase domain-containing protein [Vibrio vulnificus]
MQTVKQALLTKSLDWGDSGAEKGEVFTKPEIVNLMLVASGLFNNLESIGTRILEPSCGQGEFVLAIVRHLCKRIEQSGSKLPIAQLERLITAYDISYSNLEIARNEVKKELSPYYCPSEIDLILNNWFVHGDFLLADFDFKFTHIVGNPPYIRIETIPLELLKEYRRRFHTMIERADIYIAFYEKCLDLLAPNGTLSFICTDRWTKNRYGSKLREKIASGYQLDLFIDLYGQNAFLSDVLTYPAITQISHKKQKNTVLFHNPYIDDEFSLSLNNLLSGKPAKFNSNNQIINRNDIVKNNSPWLFGSSDELSMIARLEADYPTLEDAGCLVYIGAATGNNKVYIVDSTLKIEECRKIPVITAKELRSGDILSSGNFIINTYDEQGVLDLCKYPLLSRYLYKHEDALKSRHVAKSSPNHWYKTIDRVYPNRAKQPKLLIPDIKSELTVIFDDGKYHPNNSIYYICSNSWNLHALKALLLSGIGQIFVQAYSTKVSGGNLRFQSQHLRKIRIPYWDSINQETQEELIEAGRTNDINLAKVLASQVYNLNEKEMQIIGM